MNYMIPKKANEVGQRTQIQSWNFDGLPVGYVRCSQEFVPIFVASKGFVDIEVNGDTVVTMVENTAAREAWEVAHPPEPEEPTPDEDRDALIVDLDYRMTLLELGVI